MGHGVGKKPRGGMMRSATRDVWSAVSRRCRSTTDVPYTIRCALDAVHVLNNELHRDKTGTYVWAEPKDTVR